MPLGCDCFPGCWGHHSKEWPRITFDTQKESDEARRLCVQNHIVPYGSYVTVGLELRVEKQEYVAAMLESLGAVNENE